MHGSEVYNAEKERLRAEEKDRQFVINLLRKDYDIDQIHELTNV